MRHLHFHIASVRQVHDFLPPFIRLFGAFGDDDSLKAFAFHRFFTRREVQVNNGQCC